MIVGLILLIAMIVLATAILARKAKREGRNAPLWTIVLVNGIGVSLTLSIVGVGYYAVLQYRYDRCVSTARSRNAYRQGQLALFDAFDVFTGTTKYTMSPYIDPAGVLQLSLREGLELRSPALDPGDCQAP